MKKLFLSTMLLCSGLLLGGCDKLSEMEFAQPTNTPRPTIAPTPTPIFVGKKMREELIAEMDSSQLVEAVLQYPYLYEVRSYQKPQEGFDDFRYVHNGIFELWARPDSAVALFNRYMSSSFETYESWSNEELSDHVNRLELLEWMMAQADVLEQLSAEQQTELLQRLYDVYQLKLDAFDVYDERGLRITTFVASRLWTVNDPEMYTDWSLRVPEVVEFNKLGYAWNMDNVLSAVWFYVTDSLGIEFEIG